MGTTLLSRRETIKRSPSSIRVIPRSCHDSTSIRFVFSRSKRLNEPQSCFAKLEQTGANLTIMNGYLVGRLADDGGGTSIGSMTLFLVLCAAR